MSAVRPDDVAASGDRSGAEASQEALWPFASTGPRPEPTPPDGPDPYGNPEPEWLRIDWRPHLHQVEVLGTRVNYCEMGEAGTPIVFVHGLGGCWQNWLENIPHFARDHRVIALDLPGFGSSPMPSWEVSITNYGRVVDEFCRKLNLHSSALVGNSMGGFIAAETAIAEPEWVDRLALVSAAGISSVHVRRAPAEAISAAARGVGAVDARAARARDAAVAGAVRDLPQHLRRAPTGCVPSCCGSSPTARTTRPASCPR